MHRNELQQQREDAEQRVPLVVTTDNNVPHQYENIPYADDGEIEPLNIERKISLGDKKNVDLSITIRVDEAQQPQVEAPQTHECFSKSDDSLNKSISSNERSGRNSPGVVIKVENIGLRRNSISLPSGINALDLEALRLKHQMSEQEPISEEEKTDSRTDSIIDDISASTTFSTHEKNAENSNKITTIRYENEDTEDDEDEFGRRKPVYRDRFRSRRRASIAPLPALRLNSKVMLASDFDTHSLASNQASITSINSLASLLREKMQAFPQMIRKKKRETKDYKIKIFVTIMFFIIVFIIGYSYVTYHQQVLTRSYFDKIKFNPRDRILRILSHEEKEVIAGHLGVTLDRFSSPFHCLEDHRRKDGSVCLEWNGVARLYMNFQDLDVFRCYTMQWQALSAGFYPTDCYELKRDNGLWFGGSITKSGEWSLSTENFGYASLTTGDAKVHQFGNGVKRYFINSIGVAVQVNDETPLHIAIDQKNNELCMRGMNDNFTFVNHLTEYPELNYKICTTEDMRSLHMLMTQQSLWDGLKEADIKMLHLLIEEPIWKIPYQSEINSVNETTIYNYSEDVIAMGFMRLGHILVNEFWQENIGDFTVDRQRFPTLKDTIDVLHRRGFKVVFTIQPFIGTDSANFKEAVKKKFLIYERNSERSIPAMTRYKSSSSAGVLDITNNATIPWLLEKLEALKKEYQVDSFYFDLGTGYNLPHYYQCRKSLSNPDMYAKLFTSSLQSVGFIGVSTASVVPKPPAFLSAPPVNASWDGLHKVLSVILNYGVIGYPFVLPGAIGGDHAIGHSITKMVSWYSLEEPALVEQELYIRWMQLVTFLPAVQYSHLPSEYKSDYITEIAKELTSVRQRVVIPLLKKYLRESMDEGLPLVRPLWMLDPRDPACLMVNDEFSVGEELIVAPILEKSIDEREVYLPQGVWKDGIDGSLRKGSRWIHGYKVPKDKIAYFIKLPDNTRF